MSNAVIYSRFSPRRNAEESESCDVQERICHEHASARAWPVRSMHRDEDTSGTVVDRPGLAAALAELRRGDVLLVYRRDRLSRDAFLAELIRRQVAARGARIEAVEGDPVASGDESPEAVFVRQVLDAAAELERKLAGARTRASLRARQRAGQRVSHHLPYGFKADPKDPSRMVVDEREQPAVKRIKELAAEGVSDWCIARQMTKEMPDLCRGKAWTAKTVGKVRDRV